MGGSAGPSGGRRWTPADGCSPQQVWSPSVSLRSFFPSGRLLTEGDFQVVVPLQRAGSASC